MLLKPFSRPYFQGGTCERGELSRVGCLSHDFCGKGNQKCCLWKTHHEGKTMENCTSTNLSQFHSWKGDPIFQIFHFWGAMLLCQFFGEGRQSRENKSRNMRNIIYWTTMKFSQTFSAFCNEHRWLSIAQGFVSQWWKWNHTNANIVHITRSNHSQYKQ